jgi:serine/threonine-protein kinase
MVRLSPDGKLLALSGDGLSVYDLRRDMMNRLTSRATSLLAWAPDATHIAYDEPAVSGDTLWWRRAEGGGEPQRLLESKGRLLPYSFSHDGRRLAYAEIPPEKVSDIWTLPLDITDPDHPKPGKPELFLGTPAREYSPAFSPDGRWIAYQAGGENLEVYVRPFPGGTPTGSGQWQISSGGGQFPVWSRDGRELLYYAQGGRVMVASYSVRGDTFYPEKPQPWSNQLIPSFGMPNFDVSLDGKRLVVPLPQSTEDAKGSVHVTFLLNYFDELRRRMPAK